MWPEMYLPISPQIGIQDVKELNAFWRNIEWYSSVFPNFWDITCFGEELLNTTSTFPPFWYPASSPLFPNRLVLSNPSWPSPNNLAAIKQPNESQIHSKNPPEVYVTFTDAVCFFLKMDWYFF